MNDRSETTATDAEMRAPAMEEAVPPPCPCAMPTQVIEFWTPRAVFVALLYRLGRVVRRVSRDTPLSAADSHEPR